MDSTRPLISMPTSPSNNPLVIVPKAPITIGIIVTFMFHSFFFQFPSKIEVLIFLFTFFSVLFLGQPGQQRPHLCKLSFLLSNIRSGLLAEIRWSICMSKSHRSLCHSPKTDARWCIYHLFVWSNLNFLHSSEWITLPTQSFLVLYSFCANLLHSLMMWWLVSSLSPHGLHLLFCLFLSILALIWLILMALFCAAIRRNSVFLLSFPFLNHVQVFSCEMSFISRLKRP